VAGFLPILSRKAIIDEARRHLASLGFPLQADTPVKLLTTGEKQMVEIAKALHRNARILVLDEPTAALAGGETVRLFRIIRDLQQRGIGMIYISHHLEEVFEIADRVTVLRDGRNIATWSRGEYSEDALVQAMIGRDVAEGIRPDSAFGDEVLATRALSGAAFREVSITVRRGEILALTGAAGAGQTDLCWALYGAAPVHAGELVLNGTARRFRSLREAAAAGVLLSPGDRKTYGIVPLLDVGTNFTFADLGRWTMGGVLRKKQLREDATELIRKYGVRCTGPGQEIQSLSGGNQQKVVVGRVAERDADVYLFDEPTRGVDVGAREEIYALIHSLAARGAGIIVATPDIQEALRLGDRVGVMRQGRLVYEQPVANASEPAILAAIIGADEGEGALRHGGAPEGPLPEKEGAERG
jgi:ribose transport system ATP-binding protein